MKIREVQLSCDDTFVTLSARCKIRRVGEDVVYFRFEKKHGNILFSDASPFAAALLIPSMKQGEDLIIHGSISEALYQGMQRIMEIMLGWNIGLHPIAIKADTLVKDSQEPAGVATFFSGGADSFYTYLKHRKDRTDRLTHFLLVDGYDIDLRNASLWAATRAHVEQVAQADGIEVVTAASNIHPLLEPILNWSYAHGGCMAAIALCLRNELRKVYIPSTSPLILLKPWGTHPTTDHFWGTERLSFVHDGAEATRLEKVQREIATSQATLAHLRVCYMNVKDSYNCGRCEKCLRTMMMLKIAGVLEQAKTFPPTINEALVSHLALDEDVVAHHERNLAELRRLDMEPALQKAIEASLKNRAVMNPSFFSLVKQKVLYLDHVYNRSRLRSILSAIRRRDF